MRHLRLVPIDLEVDLNSGLHWFMGSELVKHLSRSNGGNANLIQVNRSRKDGGQFTTIGTIAVVRPILEGTEWES